MKHIKLFENFNDIDSICEKWGIKNYTINPDGSIDVQGNVDLSDMGLTKLPLRFGNVSGDFSCGNNQLITLEGGPRTVGRDFSCGNNQLITLEGGPREVGGDFYCHTNQLISLEGGPQRVGGVFSCSYNQLITLEGAPGVVGRNFSCSYNQLKSLEGSPQKVGGNFSCYDNPVEVIWNLFNDYSMIDLLNDYDPIRDDKVIVLDRLNSFLKDIGKPTVTEVKGYKCI